jgi:hypothetical protein
VAHQTPVRGQRSFNTALDPVDFSFTTYMRPADTGTNISCEEAVLWNAMFSASEIGGANPAWTDGTSSANCVVTNSDKHQLLPFGMIIVVDATTFVIDNCVLNTATVDFGLDDISFSTTCTNTSTVLVTVVPALSGNTINCPSANTFCLSGNAGIITGNNPSGGNGNYAYQWQISLNNNNWADIDGATSSSYDPGTVFTTTRFRRIVKSSSCSIESNVCTITITTGNTISNNSITAPGTATFCTSGNPSAALQKKNYHRSFRYSVTFGQKISICYR